MEFDDEATSREMHRDIKDEFDAAIVKYYKSKTPTTKSRYWLKSHIAATIRVIEEYKNAPKLGKIRSPLHYNRAKMYEVVEVAGEKFLTLKRKTPNSPIIIIVATEEYFNVISECHKETGHGGRDKMIHALKNRFFIPRPIIEIFLKLCKWCNKKKCVPIASAPAPSSAVCKDFNSRGLVDLLDLQSIPDGEYIWLLNYQDNTTKYTYLRPLKSNSPSIVARKLIKIFFDIGCPAVVQTNQGRAFTAQVLKDLSTIWPECKTTNRNYRLPATRARADRNKNKIRNLLREWMEDNNSSEWSIGCRYVQWQKNVSYDRVLRRTPYRALFGMDPKLVFKNINLPTDIYNDEGNEEMKTLTGEQDGLIQEGDEDLIMDVGDVVKCEVREGDEMPDT